MCWKFLIFYQPNLVGCGFKFCLDPLNLECRMPVLQDSKSSLDRLLDSNESWPHVPKFSPALFTTCSFQTSKQPVISQILSGIVPGIPDLFLEHQVCSWNTCLWKYLFLHFIIAESKFNNSCFNSKRWSYSLIVSARTSFVLCWLTQERSEMHQLPNT